MIAPGPILQAEEGPPPWRAWAWHFAVAAATAAVAAVGTKLGEWGVERVRARVEKKPAAEPPKTEPGA
ncbi:MAG TPA: hypothetical protein VK252_06020 [Solirubrobacteraceae bacterium]|nr:hypothetical protein [Solirubrobacteraceae bacterium]